MKKKKVLKLTALLAAFSILFSGCGSLFMENDTTVSLSSQGTEGIAEMLAQGMEEFTVEVYEEDRWSGEITSTAKAFYIDPLANDTMISFELIHHDEDSHILMIFLHFATNFPFLRRSFEPNQAPNSRHRPPLVQNGLQTYR